MVGTFKVGRIIRVKVGGLFSWGAVSGLFWRPLVLFEGIELLGRPLKCLHPFPIRAIGKMIVKWEQCNVFYTLSI